ASARVLTKAIQAELPGQTATVVFGTSADKDLSAIGHELLPIARRAIATRSSNPRAADPQRVAAALSAMGIEVDIEPDVAGAVANATRNAGTSDLILVTGSLFVVADAREAFGLATPDPGGLT
ncbi:MAG: bifunctional folylpolyglutamate synthase/dihydrofolate synthase, partial [Chloroflexota bacterium]|nr:bifunctional folylpolyglutamate synthase/dihydrofolate synthase [Chloroflexota bacterium]